MKRLSVILGAIFLLNGFLAAQPARNRKIPQSRFVEILKAEDELRYGDTLSGYMRSSNPLLRERAALAAGRIGNDDAIPALLELLRDPRIEVRRMAAFAIGEIESTKGANGILGVLLSKNDNSKARAIEAAGKIVAANRKAAVSKTLGKVILKTLQYEARKRSKPDEEAILLGITAALRARPTGAAEVLSEFLGYPNWRIRADSLNTLARLRAKSASRKARELLKNDEHPVVRANAARTLGAAGDKSALETILDVAISDTDLRVRVNAIRSLNTLGVDKSAGVLLLRAEKLFADIKSSGDNNPEEKNELLTIISTLGSILKGTEDSRAASLLRDFRVFDRFGSTETEIALAKVAPDLYSKNEVLKEDVERVEKAGQRLSWRFALSVSQGLAENSKLSDKNVELKARSLKILSRLFSDSAYKTKKSKLVAPGVLRAYLQFFPKEDKEVSNEVLSRLIAFQEPATASSSLFFAPESTGHADPFIRAAAATLLAERSKSKEHVSLLRKGFRQALERDLRYDDAQLAILSAIVKLDKNEAIESLNLALNHFAFLVRRRAANLIEANGLTAQFPNLEARVGIVNKYNRLNNSKLGQVLNKRADYKRALSRKNGRSKAILATNKGEFTIEFFPEQAPLTVDNFIKLAKSGYFNGVDIHRVVPNFVMQDGDPRGDGNGGPGWQIRCEINQIPYKRGMVGMALSGKDTGGSQWFVTHSPQPHLDGGYTVFGKVNENDMKIVDKLVRADKIVSVRVVDQY